MLTIKSATEKDIPLIRQIATQVWYRTYRFVISQDQMDFMFARMYSIEALTRQMLEGQTVLLAFLDTEPVGFASYFIEDKVVKVPKLYINTGKQGMGTGGRLLDYIASAGKAAHCNQLQLNVNRFNPAVGFYLKCGMAINEIVDIPYHSFVLNDYVMAKDL